MKFRKKPVVIDATQWFNEGDHPNVLPSVKRADGVVFQHNQICEDGGQGYAHTFSIHTLEGNHEVTKGDWIITGVMGEMYPCKPDIFAVTYEPVEPDNILSAGVDSMARSIARQIESR